MIDLGEKEPENPLEKEQEQEQEQERPTTATTSLEQEDAQAEPLLFSEALEVKQERDQTGGVRQQAADGQEEEEEKREDENFQRALRESLKVTTKSDLEEADLEQAIANSQEEQRQQDEALQRALRLSREVTTKRDLEEADLEQAIVLSLTPQKEARVRVKDEEAMGGKKITPLRERDANAPSIKGKEEVKTEVPRAKRQMGGLRLMCVSSAGRKSITLSRKVDGPTGQAKFNLADLRSELDRSSGVSLTSGVKISWGFPKRTITYSDTMSYWLEDRGNGSTWNHYNQTHLSTLNIRDGDVLHVANASPTAPPPVVVIGSSSEDSEGDDNDARVISQARTAHVVTDKRYLDIPGYMQSNFPGTSTGTKPSAVAVASTKFCWPIKPVFNASTYLLGNLGYGGEESASCSGTSESQLKLYSWATLTELREQIEILFPGLDLVRCLLKPSGSPAPCEVKIGMPLRSDDISTYFAPELLRYSQGLRAIPAERWLQDGKTTIADLGARDGDPVWLFFKPDLNAPTVPIPMPMEQEILYGYLKANVVGIQFYSGRGVTSGQSLKLTREPKNMYDKNAVRVDTMAKKQVGHLKRDQVKALAPFMDEKIEGIRLETTASESGKGRYNIACEIAIHGPVKHYSKTCSHFNRHGFKLISRGTGSRALPPSLLGANLVANLADMARYTGRLPQASSSVVTSRTVKSAQEMEDDLDKLFDELDKSKTSKGVKKLTGAELSCVKSPLLAHQKDAVAWMLHRESNPEKGKGGLPPFFEKRLETKSTKDGPVTRQVYYHSITKSSQEDVPQPVLGGILADDMGLGKTLNVLSVIAISKVKAPSDKPTLVVCPLSVMQNWESQAAEHMHGGTMTTLIYHGSNKSVYLEDLSPYDLVITTYATLASEYFPEDPKKASQKDLARQQKRRRKGIKSLFDISWRRVVLDEAHNIRNRSTKAFKSCTSVEADHRWCLTGTPYQNKAEDIQALFQFLEVSPLKDFAIWNRVIGRPLRSGNSLALSTLRVLLNTICMRRTKALLKDKIPPKTIEEHCLTLDGVEKEAYDLLFKSSKLAFTALRLHSVDEVMRHYSNILELLLRLRQACCSYKQIPKVRLENARKVVEEYGKKDLKNITLEQVKILLQKLRGELQGSGTAADANDQVETPGDNDVMECAVCFESPTSEELRILKKCSHCFCFKCLDKITSMQGSGSKCPLCREPFRSSEIFSMKELKEEEEKADVAETSGAPSTSGVKKEQKGKGKAEIEAEAYPVKIRALLESLRNHLAESPKEKFVIFSQFTAFLDIIKEALKKEIPNMDLTMLDGRMNVRRRLVSMELFKESTENPAAMLVSLKAGGVGINLTCACKVYLMDLWWNPAIEDQAMDRVHRIGQTRPVTVTRYIVDKTVEKKIAILQESKKLFGKGAMQKLSAAELRQARLALLENLFEDDEEPNVQEEDPQQQQQQQQQQGPEGT